MKWVTIYGMVVGLTVKLLEYVHGWFHGPGKWGCWRRELPIIVLRCIGCIVPKFWASSRMPHKIDFSGNLASLSMPWRSPKANVLEGLQRPTCEGFAVSVQNSVRSRDPLSPHLPGALSLPPFLPLSVSDQCRNRSIRTNTQVTSNHQKLDFSKRGSPMMAPTPKDPNVALC